MLWLQGLWGVLFLAYGSLGIIYGDIATSPLYTIPSTLTNGAANPADVYGVISLIFWTLTMVVLLKYVFIVLRADDNGEGKGIATRVHKGVQEADL